VSVFPTNHPVAAFKASDLAFVILRLAPAGAEWRGARKTKDAGGSSRSKYIYTFIYVLNRDKQAGARRIAFSSRLWENHESSDDVLCFLSTCVD
jgi:hypothetical protein